MFYDEEERSSSPGLQAVHPRATPSLSPPLHIDGKDVRRESPVSTSTQAGVKEEFSNWKRKSKPSQGDSSLLALMAPNHPDITQEAGHSVLHTGLNTDSSTESESERRPRNQSHQRHNHHHYPSHSQSRASQDLSHGFSHHSTMKHMASSPALSPASSTSSASSRTAAGDPMVSATAALALGDSHNLVNIASATLQRHMESSPQPPRRVGHKSSLGHLINPSDHINGHRGYALPERRASAPSQPPASYRHMASFGSKLTVHSKLSPNAEDVASSPLFALPTPRSISSSVEETQASSPNLSVPQSSASRSPNQRFPSLGGPLSSFSGDDSDRSPGAGLNSHQQSPQQLPSLKEMMANAPRLGSLRESDERIEQRTIFSHHHSLHSRSMSSPSNTMHSPTISRTLHPQSPPSQFPPLIQTGPSTIHSDASSPQDPFLRTTAPSFFTALRRRPSTLSDSSYAAPSSATTAPGENGYPSSDGFSPASGQCSLTPIEMLSAQQQHAPGIMDGAVRPILPPPTPTQPHAQPVIQHVPSHGSGGFLCSYQGCNALPFQTQYLLNSHANVHSQNRPHYCPVPNCPRGEGGKGFKRKNEMIRHGLVHDSPGYVCPFCPDREHRYPRPDNLQRHVRVHHVDKRKDDAELRDVLAQRPEGGSRGRRRRQAG